MAGEDQFWRTESDIDLRELKMAILKVLVIMLVIAVSIWVAVFLIRHDVKLDRALFGSREDKDHFRNKMSFVLKVFLPVVLFLIVFFQLDSR